MNFIILLILNSVLWIIFLIVWEKKYHPNVVLKNIKSEVDMLLVEIDRTIDNDITLVEGKIESLQLAGETAKRNIDDLYKTLEKTQRQIDVFKSEIEKKQKEMHILLDLERKKTQPKRTTSSVSKMQDAYTKTAQQVDLFSNKELLQTSDVSYDITIKKDMVPQIMVAQDELTKKTTTQDQILSLFRQGFTIEDIAQKMQLSQTEVTLTIEMFG